MALGGSWNIPRMKHGAGPVYSEALIPTTRGIIPHFILKAHSPLFTFSGWFKVTVCIIVVTSLLCICYTEYKDEREHLYSVSRERLSIRGLGSPWDVLEPVPLSFWCRLSGEVPSITQSDGSA